MEKPAIQTVSIDQSRQSPFAARLLAKPAAPMEPAFVTEGRDYTETVLAPGRVLVHSPNPLNDLFSLTLVFEKGTEHDKVLSVAEDLLDLCGAGDLSREQLRQEMFRLGMDLRVNVGANTSTVTVSGIDRRFEESLELLALVLTSADAPEGALAQLKDNLLARRAEQMKNPAQIAAALTSYQRHGGRSPYLDRLTEEQILALSEDDILAAAAQVLGLEHTVEYVGSRSPEEVGAVLASVLPAAPGLRPAPEPVIRPIVAPVQTEILLVDQPTAQSQVNILAAGAPYEEALTPPSTLYNNYFAGGMSGIVFQELREARALAYTARANYDLGSRPGEPSAMTGYIGTQVDKTTDAVTAFLDLWENLPVSQERLDRTITSLDNQFRTQKLGFRSVPSSLRGWREAGLPGDPRPARHAALMSSGMETLLGFHQEQVAGRPKHIGIVGDRRFIDVAALEAVAPVREVPVEQLFTP
jgi:predicted Zn-dependent peptidase